MSLEFRNEVYSGCGNIAHSFASDLTKMADSHLFVVASKDAERAASFGSQFNVVRCYDSYERLAKDKDIDVIYVATRHPMHAETTLLCLEHGKAVLYEKAFGMNTTIQLISLLDTVREKIGLVY